MIGIIGGSGLDQYSALAVDVERQLETPWGEHSGPILEGELAGRRVVFLPRHGAAHDIPPHRVNYRANLWALAQLGVTEVLAVAAVGGITSSMSPGRLVLPHDLIDYSWGRAVSFWDGPGDASQHVEFDPPYDQSLRTRLIDAAERVDIDLVALGVYGVTQGPRLETAAEIRRLERDGCDLVGMTGMPEAGLAAECGLPYACLAVVVNWAAGVGSAPIHAEIQTHMREGVGRACRLIESLLSENRR